MKNIEPDVIASINNLGFQQNSRHIFLEITNCRQRQWLIDLDRILAAI